jgi:hypothetical protein
MKAMDEFETLSAREMLATAVWTVAPDKKEAQAAAAALLKELAEVATSVSPKIGLDVDPESPWRLGVQVGRRLCSIQYNWDRMEFKAGENSEVVALEYNPLHKRFEGTEPDARFVPVPGEPKKRTPAVAVLALAVLRDLVRGINHKNGF